jgi:hypothetical protein
MHNEGFEDILDLLHSNHFVDLNNMVNRSGGWIYC